MMTLSRKMTAGHAGGYFSREDYYLGGADEPGSSLWCGKGAEALGLTGPVGSEEFRALCRGEAPDGGQLVAAGHGRDPKTAEVMEVRRAGNDATFSAPKSVSIAYVAGVEGMKEAHDAAVLSVLDHMERHYCHYRHAKSAHPGEMVAAKFDHATSRSIDPQLHSHVFLVNAVKTPDGSFRANTTNLVFEDQKLLGRLYRQALSHELTQRGFQVTVMDRSEMYIELKGMDPALVDHFSNRRKQIDHQVEKWQAEGLFTGVPHARLYEMAALETRDSKRTLTKDELTRYFERGFEACGASMDGVRLGMEREHGLAVLHEPTAPNRVVELAVRDLTDREAVIDRARLLDQAVRISGGEHSLPELNAGIDGGTEGVFKVGNDPFGREFCSTKEMLELEARNLERIRALPSFESTASPTSVNWLLERAAEDEGRTYTAGQKAEVFNELTGKRGITYTLGDPGAAKTTTLQLVERFNDQVLRPYGEEHLSINLAYTGKAARELALATGRPACTIHSFENANPASKFDLQRQNGEPPMVVVRGEKIFIPTEPGTQVVIRVDEAGFLGARQTERLLDVVEKLQQSGARVKLHLLGDSKQMQGVQAGNLLVPLRELGERGEIDYAHLTDILRQRDPGLLEIARGLNREDRLLAVNAQEALRGLAKRREMVEIADPQELRKAVVEHYLAESRKPSHLPEREEAGQPQQVLLLTVTNAARRELNREIRQARVASGEILEGKPFAVLVPVRQGVTVEGFQVGDTVQFTGTRRTDGQMERWGTRLNTEAQVTGLDRERNMVQVTYSFHTRKRDGRELSRTVTKEFSAAEMAGKTRLYREEERNFSVGDRVVLLKNDTKLDLQNGAMGVVRELDSKGRAVVDLGDRKAAIDLTRYRHLDHGYAVTVHKSQGSTVEHSILYAPVPPPKQTLTPRFDVPASEVEYGRASFNALNVSLTRAQFGTRVFTNWVEGLSRSVEMVDEKTTTLNRGSYSDKIAAKEGPLHASVRQFAEKVTEMERAVRGPEAAVTQRKAEKDLAAMSRPLNIPLPGREIAPVQKGPGRELELKGPKGFGRGFGE
ncbi:MobF family relaxase [Geomonas anaerohicana]|uniref:Relaxase domain-containing protein n=1 Tax=Geomonas anaerohicana TaxID=2798583 RepID=A0ABS0YDV5_9BACT|nr:MobF family relaxase [Geomonas anaerohicana]MBJ6750489.1 relaxase domain-containing protein [Geomonas anaerohicana]